MLLEICVLAAIISCLQPSDNMSLSPPPSYHRTTTVSEKPAAMSEKPSTMSEKPAGSMTYHLTLERCKKSVLQTSGLRGPRDTIEDRDAAITISDNATWDQVRKEIWRLYKQAWPAILGKAELESYVLAADMQYTAQEGGVYGRVSMLEVEGDAFWEFRKREDINVISLRASCAPRHGEAPGEVRSPNYVSQHLRIDQKLCGRRQARANTAASCSEGEDITVFNYDESDMALSRASLLCSPINAERMLRPCSHYSVCSPKVILFAS